MVPLGSLVCFFGRFNVARDGRPVRLRIPEPAIPLLGYCALNRARVLKRRDVAFALWPDETDSDAHAKLRRLLYKLQKNAPEAASWLSVGESTLQWNSHSHVDVDVHRFEELLSAGDPSAEAAQLYGGDFLADFDSEWIEEQRSRLRALHLANLKKLIIQSLRTGRNLDAQAFCASFFVCDPWNEEIARFAMRARYASGDRPGAMREYDAFTKVLENDLQAQPAPETVALHELILQNGALPPLNVPENRDARESAPVRESFPFVGRARELEALLSAWSSAASGRTQFVVIAADAGVGKTRLVSEFATAIEAQGARIMRGGTVRPESAPYQAICEALESQVPLLKTLALEPQTRSVLARIAPSLGTGTVTDAPLLQDQLHEAIAKTLTAAAGQRPLLLVLEDLHWAGAATVEALNYLIRRLTGTPICVLITYRPSEAPRTSQLRRVIRRNRRERAIVEMTLDGLDKRAVCELLDAIQFGQTDRGVSDLVFHASDGNPLFVGQIVDACAQRSTDDERSLLQTVHDAGEKSLSEFVEQRFETLSEQTRRAAHVACVIGAAFDAEVLTETLGWSAIDVHRTLGELLDRKIIRESTSRHHAEYAFTHEVLAATLYNGLSEAERSQRHLRVAHVLRDFYADRLAEQSQVLAFHFAHGGDNQQAATFYLASARNALRLFANQDARRMAELGLDLTSSAEERAQLLLVLDDALHRLGRFREREEPVRALLALLGELDTRLSLIVLERAATFFRGIGAREDGERIVRQMQTLATDDMHTAMVNRVLAAHHLHWGDPEAARHHAALAATQYESAGNMIGIFESRCIEIEVCVNTFDFQHARELLESLPPVDAVGSDPKLTLQHYNLRKMLAHNTLAHDEMLAVATEWMAYAREIAHLPSEVSASLDVAQALRYLQRYEEAGAVHDSILEKLPAIDDIGLQVKALGTYAQYWVDLGVPERCRDLMLQARRVARFGGDLRNRTVLALNLAITAEVMGHMSECQRFATEALSLARQLKNVEMEGRSLIQLACAQIEFGDASAAIDLVHEGMPLTRVPGRAYVIMMCLAVTGAILAKAGDLDTARRHADEALSMIANESGFPRNLQDHYFNCALVRHLCGEKAAARELIERSYASLQISAAALPPAWRAQFQTVYPAPEIIAAKERNEWPQGPWKALAEAT